MSVLDRCVLLILALLGSMSAQEIKVAAASDLNPVMQELVPTFEKQTGIHVTVSYGSSGNFFAQIQNGAPFDVFLSANTSYPEKLDQAGLAVPGSLTPYAQGALALWWRKDARFNPAPTDAQALAGNLDVLKNPDVRKIAIANPEHAPYGRAAVAALRSLGIYDQVKDKLVLGENISQTAQFAQSGNAEVAFIALSLALSGPMRQSGNFVLLPQKFYPPIEQTAVAMRSSKNDTQALRFIEFLRSPEGKKILTAFGFSTTRNPQKR